jgi:predicted HicB family RNase H-like nuclease
VLKYKGYSGIVEYDPDGKIFTGEVIGIQSMITFQGRTPEELEASFASSIDLYLEMCQEDGVQPEKPYSGRFNLRISPELHKVMAERAAVERKSLNQLVTEILQRSL